MIITWKIGYSDNLVDVSNSELASQIMPIFGLDDDEYKVCEDHVEATPTVFTISKWISGVRFSVYDIRIENKIEKKVIEIKIRLFKLFVLPLIFPLIGLFSNFDFIPLDASLIAYGICVILFGLMTFLELAGDKSRIRKKIKTLANNT
jgi:hypothetical protein